MAPTGDSAALRRHVVEAARVMNLPLHESWHASIAEHLARLFEAAAMVDAASPGGESANVFEP
jgi:hypothetical protein